MKNNFTVLAVAIVMSISASCQGVKVPEAVKKAFAAKFPDATNVKWGKENSREYEAEFKFNNSSIAANFAADGSWVVTETTITAGDLPVAVTNAINTKYPGATFVLTEKVEKPGDKVYYEVIIKVNDKKKEVELNADGSLVK
jgi:hypothetical protein